MKKYAVINGSPRCDGNSDRITDMAVNELKNSGAQVEVFKVREHETKNCIGCDSCKRTGHCIRQDDASAFIEESTACDGILFVSPLYFGAAPGTLKVLVDRFYVLFNPLKEIPVPSKEKKCGIVLTYGSTPESEAQKAAGVFQMCGSVAGFGSTKTVLCGNENAKNAFVQNEGYRAEVKKLLCWLEGEI